MGYIVLIYKMQSAKLVTATMLGLHILWYFHRVDKNPAQYVGATPRPCIGLGGKDYLFEHTLEDLRKGG